MKSLAVLCILNSCCDVYLCFTRSAPQVSRWRIADLQFAGGPAAEAQEFLCQHSERVRRLSNIQVGYTHIKP